MASPEEMEDMQWRLDQSRAQLVAIRDRVQHQQRRRGRPRDERRHFTDAINRLIALDAYQARGIGWARDDPQGDQRYRYLKGSQADDRAAVRGALRDVENRAEAAHSRDTEALRQDRQLFRSIPAQERNLYRARREWARSITEDTVEAVPFATNQISDIANSGGQSYEALMTVLLDDTLRMPTDRARWLGQTAVLASHVGAGACDEQSAYAFTEANKRLPGTQVTRANLEPGHAMVIIGPPNRPESAHIDTWPLQPRVTNPQTYGLDNIQDGSVDYSRIADGQDLRALAWPTLRHPLPDPPAPRSPIPLAEAGRRMQEEEIGEEVYHITSTGTIHNSDSDRGSDREMQGYGHSLSREAFTANLDNDFVIQPRPAGRSSTTGSPSLSDSSQDMTYGDPSAYDRSPGAGQVQFGSRYGPQDVQYSTQSAPYSMVPDATSFNPTGVPYGSDRSQQHSGPSASYGPPQPSQQPRRSR
ncbi:hypothetical protein ACFUIW_28630 [Streptomyces sp. NPDC057245]|uniref:hypothetical protein n=1 Tax=Streptomyces sp. NPDC057245 TaxID=3346065 RepID=UPI00363CB523